MIRTALAGVLVSLLLPVQSAAQEEGAWTRYIWRQRCYQHTDMFGAVTYPCRRWRVPVRDYDEGPRVYGYERREREREYYSAPNLHPVPYYGPRCKDRIVTAVGFEYANPDRALKSAQLVYASTVRQEYGEMYQEITEARDVLTLCTQASVNDTQIGKLGEAVFGENAILKRCKIWARPCRPEIERTSFNKDGKVAEPAYRNADPRDNYYEPEKPKKRFLERWRRTRQ